MTISKLREELILAGTSPREIHKFVIARFAASKIPDDYSTFFSETIKTVKNEDQFHDWLIAHCHCLVGLIRGLSRDSDQVALILLDVMKEIINGQRK
jgi:hypothetical protein